MRNTTVGFTKQESRSKASHQKRFCTCPRMLNASPSLVKSQIAMNFASNTRPWFLPELQPTKISPERSYML